MKLDFINVLNGFLLQSTPDPIRTLQFDLNNQWMDDATSMSIVGMIVVFSSLIILAVIIFNISKLLTYKQKKRLKEQGIYKVENQDIAVSGEINAAIALALSMYFAEIHDDETTILTIKRAPRPYSPWSSKIYSLRDIFKNYRV
jgi:Na+-transporting methylmalonyl-CoA/oxaloacetate decarboxylase gamma subunit